jgi:hypothetical protein
MGMRVPCVARDRSAPPIKNQQSSIIKESTITIRQINN